MLPDSILNRRYMVVLYVALGIGGSAFSVLAIGAAIFSTAKLAMRRLTITRSPAAFSLAIAGLCYLASGLLMIANNPTDTSNYSIALERLVFLGFLPLFLQISLSHHESLRNSLETGSALGAVAVAVWALAEWSVSPLETVNFRAYGAPGNPGPFATSAAILFAVCLLAAFRPDRTRRSLFVAACACGALAVLMSGMRTLFPVLFLLPVLVALTWPEARRRLINRRSLWVLAAMALVLLAVGGPVAGHRVAHLLDITNATGLSPNADNSLGQRIALWQCAIDAFRQAPVFGLGRGAAMLFMSACTNNLVGVTLDYSHFHNALATAAAFGGLVEISATLALLLVPLHWCWHYRREADRRYGVILILSVLVVYGFNGTANLMLGHDIHDALYLHLMSVAFVLLAGDTSKVQSAAAE